MVKLMTYAGTAAADAPGTRTGGVPLTPPGFVWPSCRECDGAMQFVAQVDLADAGADVEAGGAGLLSIFMCQNDPGLCDEWDPDAGGNKAFVLGPGAVHAATPPPGESTLLEEVSAVRCTEVDADTYPEAMRTAGAGPREVLGQLGGRPAWLQDDETPACGECGQPMTFVVQLEEGHDHRTAANFGGGGCGYGFRCGACDTAAFLFQC